jgi:ABC-type multidrug transport system fused ATPase/permease subunit
VNRVFSDMSVIKNGIMNILPSLIGIVVSFVGAAGILIAMDWHFVILMLAGGILGLALVILFRGPMKARHKRMQEAEGALHSSTQETFVNIRLIKSSLSEPRAMRRIGADQNITPREVIRDFIELLDLLYQNPAMKIGELLESDEFSFTKSEAVSDETEAGFAEFTI